MHRTKRPRMLLLFLALSCEPTGAALSGVTLALYSVLGERVATLVDGEREAGWHLEHWGAARPAAGIYLLRLQAGGETRTSKLVVTK